MSFAENVDMTGHVENVKGAGRVNDRIPDNTIEDGSAPSLSPAETRRLLRKIDCRVIPILAVLYLLSFLDRGGWDQLLYIARSLAHPKQETSEMPTLRDSQRICTW
jgi:hypothetical protein